MYGEMVVQLPHNVLSKVVVILLFVQFRQVDLTKG